MKIVTGSLIDTRIRGKEVCILVDKIYLIGEEGKVWSDSFDWSIVSEEDAAKPGDHKKTMAMVRVSIFFDKTMNKSFGTKRREC